MSCRDKLKKPQFMNGMTNCSTNGGTITNITNDNASNDSPNGNSDVKQNPSRCRIVLHAYQIHSQINTPLFGVVIIQRLKRYSCKL